VYDHESRELNDAHHLAAITALIGPPPKYDFGSLVGNMVEVDKENFASF
jgi:hypothetical protein